MGPRRLGSDFGELRIRAFERSHAATTATGISSDLSTFSRLRSQSNEEIEANSRTAANASCRTAPTTTLRKSREARLHTGLREHAFEAICKHGLRTLARHSSRSDATSDNERFLRFWHEVAHANDRFRFTCRELMHAAGKQMVSIQQRRRISEVVWKQRIRRQLGERWRRHSNTFDDLGKRIHSARSRTWNRIFRPCITWSNVTTGSFRRSVFPQGFIFDDAGPCLFADERSDVHHWLS